MRSILRGCVIAALAVCPALLATRADAFCGFYVGGADAKMFNDATVVDAVPLSDRRRRL